MLFWFGSLWLSAVPTRADFKVGVYKLNMYYLVESGFESQFFVFEGTMELSVTTTSHIDTDYGSYENVRTEVTESFILYGKNVNGTIIGEDLRSYYDAKEHEVLSSGAFKFNITGKPIYRYEFQYHRGNFIEYGPMERELFATTPGTTWSSTYEETYYVNDQLESITNKNVSLELKEFKTKTVAAGSFECARLKRSSFEEGEYLGYDYIFITQIGDETLLVYEESYNEESQLQGTQELISLALPFPETTSFTMSMSQTTPTVSEGSPLLFFGGVLVVINKRLRQWSNSVCAYRKKDR